MQTGVLSNLYVRRNTVDKTVDKLKLILEREKFAKLIYSELNNFVHLRDSLSAIIKHIRALTACEAVSIRLHDDGDYPYYVSDGFPESFIQKENSLCEKDDNGKRILSPDGKGCLLECMCGNIIRGRFDPSLPFFTKDGSFWSNNTSVLLASTSEEDRQSRTRNYCNSCGYESVALVPIKVKGDRIGLIQLNDKRIGMFGEGLIEYIEMIGKGIGLAVQNSLLYEKVEAASSTDVLTGLWNRRIFWELIGKVVATHKRSGDDLCLILGDIDRFKSLNDSLGHEVGDQGIIHTASLIQACCREQDMVFRWGGDEFLFVLPKTTLEGAVILAEKLCRTLEDKALTINGAPYSLTMSFGVTLLRHNEPVQGCIARCDKLMYGAKRGGRNRVESE